MSQDCIYIAQVPKPQNMPDFACQHHKRKKSSVDKIKIIKILVCCSIFDLKNVDASLQIHAVNNTTMLVICFKVCRRKAHFSLNTMLMTRLRRLTVV